MRLNEYTQYIQKSLFPDIVPDDKHRAAGIYGYDNLNKDWYFSKNNDNFALDRRYLKIIDKECSQIINEYKKIGKVLFRGARESNAREISPNIGKNVPRNDRKPKDTMWNHHDMMNNLFYDKFGWYVRSEGVFTSSSPSTAKSFGNLNLFLPANGYKYVWSERYKDLYSDFLEDLEGHLDMMNRDSGYWVDDKTGEQYSSLEDMPGYRRHKYDDYSDVDNASVTVTIRDDKNNEIEMKLTWHNEMNRDDERLKLMKNAVRRYSNVNLEKAIKISSEIVFKCKYYYFIGLRSDNVYRYNDLIIEDFGLGLD